MSGGDTRCSINIGNVTREDWGDWMCLMQDGEEFSIDQGYVNVKGAQDAMTTLSWDHHAPDTRLLRVIEDTDCEQPSVTRSALEHVETVDNVRLVT